MKSQTIICIAFIQLAIGFVIPPHNKEPYFTLKTRDGEETTGNLVDFNNLLREITSELEAIPKYGQILDDEYTKLYENIDGLTEEGADKHQILLATANGLADIYEKIFSAAGMELKIYNRNQYMFIP